MPQIGFRCRELAMRNKRRRAECGGRSDGDLASRQANAFVWGQVEHASARGLSALNDERVVAPEPAQIEWKWGSNG